MGPATICDAARAGKCELYNLGYCYQYGKGVEQDMKKAIELYT